MLQIQVSDFCNWLIPPNPDRNASWTVGSVRFEGPQLPIYDKRVELSSRVLWRLAQSCPCCFKLAYVCSRPNLIRSHMVRHPAVEVAHLVGWTADASGYHDVYAYAAGMEPQP